MNGNIAKSSTQRGEEAILSEQERALGVQVRGVCHTELQRKYPVTNTKELSCNNANYVVMNKKLDCFGLVEPHNDATSFHPLRKADLRTEYMYIDTNSY